eukprot:5072800-Heterocapsa_arctica.AAC.1
MTVRVSGAQIPAEHDAGRGHHAQTQRRQHEVGDGHRHNLQLARRVHEQEGGQLVNRPQPLQ